jgi:hypothetical protein
MRKMNKKLDNKGPIGQSDSSDMGPLGTYVPLWGEKTTDFITIPNPIQCEIYVSPEQECKIHFFPPNGEQGTLVSIHSDGRVTFGPKYTATDEESLEFWNRLAMMVPKFKETIIEEYLVRLIAMRGI